MPKKQPIKERRQTQPAPLAKIILALVVVGTVLAVISAVWVGRSRRQPDRHNVAAAVSNSSPTNSNTAAVPTLEVAKAVMVTVELDFGPKVPSIAEGLQQIERRYVPEDGQGRTFAILDAYGEPTADGKLHISMHVSSEKPGMGSLVFKPTGKVLWQSKIVPATNAPPFTGKDLTILLDDGTGKTLMVDGSKGPASILDAGLRNSTALVRDFWPDGAERELTYIYSACGCPVKVMNKRVGERAVRIRDMPVIFPDDPAVVQVITRLMGW